MERLQLNSLIAGFAAIMLASGGHQSAAQASLPTLIPSYGAEGSYRTPVGGQRYSQAAPLMEYIETNAVYDGRPTRGRGNGGGGSRGPCHPETGSLDLIALVPPALVPSDGNGTPQDSVLSLTTVAQPMIWVYLPYEQEGNLTLEIALNDANGNAIEETQFQPVGLGPGIVQIPISQDFALVEGERYNWFLNASCTAETEPDANGAGLADPPLYVSGWIERVVPPADLERQLAAATPRDQAALYANHGIWQEALTFVAQRYRDQPQHPEAQADWTSLLESAAFDADTEALLLTGDLLDCCGPATGDRP